MNSVRSSVIVPCYNTEAYLPAALESIFAQKRVPDEVIIIDDGSTDGSAALVRHFGSRVRYQLQDHAGEGAARNHGLRLAQGEYIGFLDADDLWPEAAFGTLLAHLQENPALDLAYGRIEQFISPELDEAARAGLHCPPGAEAARLSGSTLFRRRNFDSVGDFNTAVELGTVVDWMARFEERGLSSAVIDEIVLRRRIHKTNLGILKKQHRGDYLHVLKASLDRRRRGGASGSAAE